MMEGREKNCIGVRCANDTSCETVPQMSNEYQDLQIAHVSGRGLQNMEIGEMQLLFHSSLCKGKALCYPYEFY